MTTAHRATIGDVVLFEFVVTSVYALFVIMGVMQPETLLGVMVGDWIDFTAPAVQVLIPPVPVPDGFGEGALFAAIGVYRHILAACFVIACGCFARSRRHWRYWGERIRGRLSTATGSPGSRYRLALFGYRRTLLGLVAVMLLALFVETQMPAIAGYLFGASWTYIRAPILIAIAYLFACRAAALRISLIKPH
jgi:hypothetical protein